MVSVSALSSEYASIKINGGTIDASAYEGSAIGGRFDDNYRGKVIIRGSNTVVHATSETFVAIGTEAEGSSGITVESYSGDKKKSLIRSDPDLYYEGAKYTAGLKKESAQILPADERRGSRDNSKYKYVLIEPCDHKDADGKSLLDENNTCFACANMGRPVKSEYDITFAVGMYGDAFLMKNTLQVCGLQGVNYIPGEGRDHWVKVP